MVSPIVLSLSEPMWFVRFIPTMMTVMQRRRVKHTTSLVERIAKRAAGVAALAEAHLEGSRERERLMRRVRQADSSPPANVPAVRTTGRRPLSRGEGGRNDPADRKRNQESRL
jgi:hypothetical protein